MCNIWLVLCGNVPTVEVDNHGDFLSSSGWGHLHLSQDPEFEIVDSWQGCPQAGCLRVDAVHCTHRQPAAPSNALNSLSLKRPVWPCYSWSPGSKTERWWSQRRRHQTRGWARWARWLQDHWSPHHLEGFAWNQGIMKLVHRYCLRQRYDSEWNRLETESKRGFHQWQRW